MIVDALNTLTLVSFHTFGVCGVRVVLFLLAVKFNVNNSRSDLLHHISDEVVFVAETVGVLLTWQQNPASTIVLSVTL